MGVNASKLKSGLWRIMKKMVDVVHGLGLIPDGVKFDFFSLSVPKKRKPIRSANTGISTSATKRSSTVEIPSIPSQKMNTDLP